MLGSAAVGEERPLEGEQLRQRIRALIDDPAKTTALEFKSNNAIQTRGENSEVKSITKAAPGL